MTTRSLTAAVLALVAGTAAGAPRGQVHFEPSGQPGRGTLVLHTGGLAREVALAPDGGFGVPEGVAPPAAPEVELLVAPGLRVPARARWDGQRLEIAAGDGHVLHGRVVAAGRRTPVAGARAVWSRGRVDPRDVADAEEAGAAQEQELVSFPRFAPLELAPDGRFGPVWAAAAPAYLLAASAEGLWGQARLAAPDAPFGGAWSVELELQPATGVEVTFEAPSGAPLGFQLKPVRVPDSAEGHAFYLPLRALDARLAAAIYGEGRIPLVSGQRVRLAPLPPDSSIDLVLEAPTGEAAPARRVTLAPGKVARVTLDAAEHLADARGAVVEGRVTWGGGTPVAEATVVEVTRDRSARTAADGTFRLPRLPHAPLTLRLERFDPAYPERVAFHPVPVAAGEQIVRVDWEVAPYTWIRARWREWPTVDEGPDPVYVLEARDATGQWRTRAADVFRPLPDGVEVSVEPSGEPACCTYRVRALWGTLLESSTDAVELPPNASTVEAAFRDVENVRLLAGVVRSAQGQPQSGARVTVQGPGGLPPLVTFADGQGRFTLGRANVAEVTLVAESAAGAVERVVRPAEQAGLLVVTVGSAVDAEP